MVRSIISLSLLVTSSLTFAASHQEVLLSGQVFEKDFKSSIEHQFVNSKIENVTTEDSRENIYKPKLTKSVTGDLTTYVIDFEPTSSPMSVIGKQKELVEHLGYAVEFECSGSDCGSQEGWTLFQGEYALGETKNQHYIFAQRKLYNKDMYLSAYVNEATDRPRLIINVIDSWVNNPDEVINNIDKEVSESGKHIITDSLFDLDSYNYNNTASLAPLAQYLKNNKGKQYKLVGHTDAAGSPLYNKKLSEKRAKAIRDILVKSFKVDKRQLSTVGIGELSPKQPNNDNGLNPNNRRVELVLNQ